MKDERLADNFMLSEFLQSETATRRGIKNEPTEAHLNNMRESLGPGMQRVRNLLNSYYDGGGDVVITITSGYRSKALNTAIKGSFKSQHCDGLAGDFIAPTFGTPKEICELIEQHKDVIQFDQLIHEGDWVHISFAAPPRKEVLTAHFENGGVRYTRGIA